MIERAAANQLQSFLEETSTLDPFQYGFRPGHGVETALVALLDDIRRHLDRGGSALLVLLDLTAEFDTVDHELLASRLNEAGIHGSALKCLTSFLQNRNQTVTIGEEKSHQYPLQCGVPQGAILSPCYSTSICVLLLC